jgi:Membrane-associated sensor, integral membrane domain
MVVVGEFGQGTALLSSAPPGRRERVVALSIAAASALTLVLAAPFARVQLPEIKAFIPAYQAALLITDLITAVLLYGLFARARSVALLVLASGYLFDALMIVPHTLTFPGVFTASGLLGAGVQSTAWLFYFWHRSVTSMDVPITSTTLPPPSNTGRRILSIYFSVPCRRAERTIA